MLRKSVRAVLLNNEHHILLSKVTPLGIDGSKQCLWVTLGGRLEDGENLQEALGRELSEELGDTPYVIGPLLWEGNEQVLWSGKQVHLLEYFFRVDIPSGEYKFLGASHEEIAGTHELRWWSAEEIAGSSDRFVPCELASLLFELKKGFRELQLVRLEPPGS